MNAEAVWNRNKHHFLGDSEQDLTHVMNDKSNLNSQTCRRHLHKNIHKSHQISKCFKIRNSDEFRTGRLIGQDIECGTIFCSKSVASMFRSLGIQPSLATRVSLPGRWPSHHAKTLGPTQVDLVMLSWDQPRNLSFVFKALLFGRRCAHLWDRFPHWMFTIDALKDHFVLAPGSFWFASVQLLLHFRSFFPTNHQPKNTNISATNAPHLSP